MGATIHRGTGDEERVNADRATQFTTVYVDISCPSNP
jgi:hypothetical protein